MSTYNIPMPNVAANDTPSQHSETTKDFDLSPLDTAGKFHAAGQLKSSHIYLLLHMQTAVNYI